MTADFTTAAPASDQALLEVFDRQASWCQLPSPFSARVLQRSRLWLQDQPAARALLCKLAADPLAAAVPLRWLAALHLLALKGLPPWAQLWPPAGTASGAPTDADLDAAISRAWHSQRTALRLALQSPPQTNEVQRSAALLPGLLHAAAQTGLPLVLLEIGASAGLNLWCDHYRHDHGSWTWAETAPGLVLRSEWLGPPPPLHASLHISRRAGCDANPIDLDDPVQALRLASYIWPDQPERMLRLRQAQQVAAACMARSGVRIQTAAAADFLRLQLRQRRPGQAAVLMHSVVWQYLRGAEQADIEAQMQAAGSASSADSPLVWLRFEPPLPELVMELRCRIWPDGGDQLLARCHPHGARIEWLV